MEGHLLYLEKCYASQNRSLHCQNLNNDAANMFSRGLSYKFLKIQCFTVNEVSSSLNRGCQVKDIQVNLSTSVMKPLQAMANNCPFYLQKRDTLDTTWTGEGRHSLVFQLA